MPENPRPLVLIVDDDPDLTALARHHVNGWGYQAESVPSARQMRHFLERRHPDVMLLDVLLGDADGSELVAEVKERHPELPVIMITRDTSLEAAVRSMKRGAADYITKPLDFDRLRQAVVSALELGRLSRRTRAPRAAPGPRRKLLGILGQSPPMKQLFEHIENVAPTDVSALLLGETGTGKELVARAIHRSSARREGPFVAVNAAAIPSELIESSLFGHRKGAFTGAYESHVGTCEQADGGTLFLDEIAEMGYEVQAKLLRFLQDHQVQRLGAREAVPVDVRVLAATNVDPMEAIAQHRLREDLYYRLRVVSLRLPPLRDRSGDIELLARHFLDRAAARHGRAFQTLDAAALVALERYPWPGNVRELANVIEEAVVLHRGEELVESMLPAELRVIQSPTSFPPTTPSRPLWNERQLAERTALEEALESASGEPEAAAQALGISRATIYRRMKKYELTRRG